MAAAAATTSLRCTAESELVVVLLVGNSLNLQLSTRNLQLSTLTFTLEFPASERANEPS